MFKVGESIRFVNPKDNDGDMTINKCYEVLVSYMDGNRSLVTIMDDDGRLIDKLQSKFESDSNFPKGLFEL